MKKFGFTLAEVLITLAIIGVVAALTTPALVKNSGQAKIGPSLAKFVNSFETGIEQMFHHESLSSVTSNDLSLLPKYVVLTGLDGTYEFTDALGKNKYSVTSSAAELQEQVDKLAVQEVQEGHHGIEEFSDYTIRMFAQAVAAANGVTNTVYQMKDGSIVAILPRDVGNIVINQEGSGSYKNMIAEVLYDIDGNKAQNKAGKDVFAFFLDGNGTLVPVGSNAHKTLGWGGLFVSSVKREENGSTDFGYPNACSTNTDDLSANFACTGKIADNNYKAN